MKPSEFDLVVVGAGALGLCTAFAAVQSQPEWSILVVDQDRPGGGATRWSAGLAVPFGSTLAHPALVSQATATLQSWSRPLHAEADRLFEELPHFVVGSYETVSWLDDRALPGVLVPADAASVRRAYPNLRVHSDEVVLRCAGTYRIFAEPFTDAVWRYLVAQPLVSAWTGTKVISVRPLGNGSEVRTATGAVIGAARVVLALGAWFTDTARPHGVRSLGSEITAKRVVGLHCAVPAAPGAPVVTFLDDDLFVMPDTANDSTFVSFYRDEWLSPGEAPSATLLSQDDLDVGLAALGKRSNGLATSVVGGRVAYDGYARDRLPVVRHLEDRNSVIAVAGGSGSGLRLAPALAVEAVRLLVERADREMT